MSSLTLLLSGPLAAWADGPGYQTRTTFTQPDRRQILGLIGCAMGIPRHELNPCESLTMTVLTVREPRVEEDYHTVDRDNGTIILHDQVCMDGRWQVILHGEHDLLEQVKHAFLHPMWAPYLGRRAYMPDQPILSETTVINTDMDVFDQVKEANK